MSSEKTSVRIELEYPQHRKLLQLSRNQGLPYTQIFRNWLDAQPLGDLGRAEHELPKRVYQRLLEIGSGNPAMLADKIEECYQDLVAPKTEEGLKDAFARWSRRLNRWEKALFVNYVQFNAPRSGKDVTNWYGSLQDGEYMTFTEEITNEFGGGGFESINRYEAKVLNSHTMPIVDVDITKEECQSDKGIVVRNEKQAISALKAWAEINEQAFRIYRTAAGLRYICISHHLEPAQCQEMMTALYADPLYVRLCLFQNCYRARLTPKPWRWQQVDWEQGGDTPTVTARFIGTVGAQLPALFEFEPMIQYHDDKVEAFKTGVLA